MNAAIGNIVVTTDFSETSYQAFPLAATIAGRFDAQLHLLYVLKSPDPFWVGNPTMGPVLPTEEELRDEALERMEKLIETRFDGLSKRPTPAIVNGQSYRAILNYAGKNHIDMIIMATHGHTGLQHVLIGSTAERVVRHAACPVLTVRAVEVD